MTGFTPRMTSPSRSTTSRRTPCVLGCWGPKLTVSSSPWPAGGRSPVRVIVIPCTPVCSSLVSAIRSSLRGRSLPGLVILREVDGLAADRVVTAQGMPDPIVGHQDPGEVGMALEHDAEHVPGLTLVPVGRGVDVMGARHPSIVLRHEDPDP